EVAAHGNAFRVGLRDPARVVQHARGEVVPAEETDRHAWSGGGIGFLPRHRVEYLLAGVRLRPHGGEPARAELADLLLVRLAEPRRAEQAVLRVGLDRELAGVVVLLWRGGRVVGV